VFFLSKISSLVSCLLGRPGACPGVEHLKGALPSKLWPYSLTLGMAGMAAGTKHSSLLRKIVNYVRKKFHNIVPCMCFRYGTVAPKMQEDFKIGGPANVCGTKRFRFN
jgi:hypothetical protein